MATHIWKAKKISDNTKTNLRNIVAHLVQVHSFPIEHARLAAIWVEERRRQGSFLHTNPIERVLASRQTWLTDERLGGEYERLVGDEPPDFVTVYAPGTYVQSTWERGLARGDEIYAYEAADGLIGGKIPHRKRILIAKVFVKGDEADSTAALITAAPLLLVAVGRALDDHTIEHHNGKDNFTCPSCNIFRTAIAVSRS